MNRAGTQDPPLVRHESIADALGLPTSDIAPRRPRAGKRHRAALLFTASFVGLWLGLSAPTVSPVAPTPPVVSTPQGVAAPAPVGDIAPDTDGDFDARQHHGRR